MSKVAKTAFAKMVKKSQLQFRFPFPPLILFFLQLLYYFFSPKMGKTSKQLTPRKKAVVIELNKVGFSARKIAKKLDFHQTKISKFLKRAQEDGTIERRTGSGRPRISTEKQDEGLERLSLKDRFKSAMELKSEWRKKERVLESKSTINRRLLERDLPARRP